MKDRDNRTPSHEAIQEGPVEEVEILPNAGAKPDVRSSEEEFLPIHHASSPEKVTLLLDAGADPDARNSSGGTRF